MNINEKKLERLVEHYEDGNDLTPAAVASVIRFKVENEKALLAYVNELAEKVDKPELVEEFQAQLAKGPDAEEEGQDEPQREPGKGKDEIPAGAENATQSQPKGEDLEVRDESGKSIGIQGSQGHVGTPGVIDENLSETDTDLSGLVFFYTDPDTRVAKTLVVSKQKGNVVSLTDKPADDMVTVMLAGSTENLNLTQLLKEPAGSLRVVGGREYTVATLVAVAQAARA